MIDNTTQRQIKIRVREPLRVRLEASAREAGYPLSTEIVRRLEQTVRDDDGRHGPKILSGGAVMDISAEAMSQVLDTLLRISERLERLERIENLLRDYLEHERETEQRHKRMLAAISLIAGNGSFGDE